MSRVAHGVGLVALLAALAGASGCVTQAFAPRDPPRLAPFTTDGCSLFPDGTFSNKTLWIDCCIEHDIAYWKGGTEEDRRNADADLRDCIADRTGDPYLARTVFDAVRIWGAPFFPTWYRWGYGWPYGRPYSPLTPGEQAQVDERLHAWRSGPRFRAIDAAETPSPLPRSSP